MQVRVTVPAQHHLHTTAAQPATLSINSYTASMQHLLLQDVPAASMPAVSMPVASTPAASMPAASVLSLQQVEAQMVQNPVLALNMLSLQQVEAQQAAQQLLQGSQQQAAAEPPTAFGSVDFIPGLGPANFIDSAADAGESSQVRIKMKESVCSNRLCAPPLTSAASVWPLS